MARGDERSSLGTFKDLANKIKRRAGDWIQDILPEDCSFTVSPEEFQEFKEICYRLKISTASTKLDYNGTTLQFLNVGAVHIKTAKEIQRKAFFKIKAQEIAGGWDQVLQSSNNWTLMSTCSDKIMLHHNDGTQESREPDWSLTFAHETIETTAGLVGEINYHRRLSNKALEKKYTPYLLCTKGATQGVIVTKLWCGGDVNDVDGLLKHLDECYIAFWVADSTLARGYTTVINWEPVTKPDGKVELYLSDLIANGKNGVTLPEAYTRPKNGR